MLTKEQAEAAAQALLSEAQKEQSARAAKVHERTAPKHKWIGVGAIMGASAGGLVGNWLFPPALLWIFGGMVIGTALGFWRSSRQA